MLLLLLGLWSTASERSIVAQLGRSWQKGVEVDPARRERPPEAAHRHGGSDLNPQPPQEHRHTHIDTEEHAHRLTTDPKMVFCDPNMAMGMGMNGYTFGPKPEDGCFIFLYKDYVIDTEAKYAGWSPDHQIMIAVTHPAPLVRVPH